MHQSCLAVARQVRIEVLETLPAKECQNYLKKMNRRSLKDTLTHQVSNMMDLIAPMKKYKPEQPIDMFKQNVKLQLFSTVPKN